MVLGLGLLPAGSRWHFTRWGTSGPVHRDPISAPSTPVPAQRTFSSFLMDAPRFLPPDPSCHLSPPLSPHFLSGHSCPQCHSVLVKHSSLPFTFSIGPHLLKKQWLILEITILFLFSYSLRRFTLFSRSRRLMSLDCAPTRPSARCGGATETSTELPPWQAHCRVREMDPGKHVMSECCGGRDLRQRISNCLKEGIVEVFQEVMVGFTVTTGTLKSP